MFDGLTVKNSNRATEAGATVCSMVDEQRVLRVVKRLFSNSVREVLGELLQNSQRAGAKTVWITANVDSLIISDDGTGLCGGGAAQFSPLMRIAESSYERPEVIDQDPMGVGLFSLFALEGVRAVKIASNGIALQTDTDRLWNEDGYWQTWESRVAPLETNSVIGLQLEISAAPELIKQIVANLKKSPEYGYGALFNELDSKSAACGYAGVLEVSLDCESLDTTCAFAEKMDETFLETDYLGNRLLVGADVFGHRANLVNWYGQLIKGSESKLRYYLEVRQGRPVNPLSPSRRGIIADSSLAAFNQFLVEKLRAHILTEPIEKLSALMVDTAYAIDKTWAHEFCPYLTAKRRRHDAAVGSFENWTGDYHEKSVLAYASNPLIIEESVALRRRDSESNELSNRELLAYGAQSFVPIIEKTTGTSVYEVCSANLERLNVQQLWWQPGAALEDFFVRGGEFALGAATLEIAPDTGWLPIDDAIVFAFEWAENFDISATENLTVGVSDTLGSKLDFLTVDAWCVWSSENDDEKSDTMEDDFRHSLEAVKAALFKDCLPDDCFDLCGIKPYFELEPTERIARLELLYSAENNSYNPIGLRLETNLNRTLEKQFLSSAEASVRLPS